MELGDKGFMKGDETGRSGRASVCATGLRLSCYCLAKAPSWIPRTLSQESFQTQFSRILSPLDFDVWLSNLLPFVSFIGILSIWREALKP